MFHALHDYAQEIVALTAHRKALHDLGMFARFGIKPFESLLVMLPKPKFGEDVDGYGLRPVPEIQFTDYILPAFGQLVSEAAARLRYRSNGEFWAPITVRSPYGGGIFGGQTHSQSPEAIFAHITGLKTVIPSTPHDAKALARVMENG